MSSNDNFPADSSFFASIEEIERRLAALITEDPLAMLIRALGAESDAHLVGGTIRDIALTKPVNDFDLASNLKPEEVQAKLEPQDIHVVDTGAKHGTVTAVVNQHNIEITTFRKAGPVGPGHYGESILSDLAARDFTVNAIAFSVNARKIIDPIGGLGDLEQRLLRATPTPYERFSEDPLRILRMVRFGAASGFKVESDTWEAARSLTSKVMDISPERIRDELVKILCSNFPAAGLRAMRNLGILDLLIPEVKMSYDFVQNRYHTQDVFEHTLSVIENLPPDPVLRLAGLFHDLGKPPTLSTDENGDRHFFGHEKISTENALAIMRRLRFSNDDIDSVTSIVRHHMRPINVTAPGLRRLMRDLGAWFEKWRVFKEADATPVFDKKDVLEELGRFDNLIQDELARVALAGKKKLAISGYDIMSLGVPEGPAIGKIIKDLEELVIDDPTLNERETLLEKAKTFFNQSTKVSRNKGAV